MMSDKGMSFILHYTSEKKQTTDQGTYAWQHYITCVSHFVPAQNMKQSLIVLPNTQTHSHSKKEDSESS